MNESPILEAIDFDAYQWLAAQAPYYLAAIEQELQLGRKPEDIRRVVSQNAGPERQALAARCEQAARYIIRLGGPL